jgi:hypothetical protein
MTKRGDYAANAETTQVPSGRLSTMISAIRP